MMNEEKVKVIIEKLETDIREYNKRIARTNNIDVLRFLKKSKSICEAQTDALNMVLRG